MTLLVAMLLLQAPPTCDDGGVMCSGGGFLSTAALAYGSGTPDFTCGSTDELPDGGWGPGSKYCRVLTRETAAYTGNHGDLTVSTLNKRSAGWLFSVENDYWASGFTVFRVEWNGDVRSWGSYFASTNGGGLRNPGSYVGVFGQSPVPQHIAHVVVGKNTSAALDEWLLQASDDSGPHFGVRRDGLLQLGGVELRFAATDCGLEVTQPTEDGGTRHVVLPWSAQHE